MQVFAFEWCPCIFESAFGVVSLHATKRSAVKAMTRYANKMWQEGRDRQLSYGDGFKPRFSPLVHEAWRVSTITLGE